MYSYIVLYFLFRYKNQLYADENPGKEGGSKGVIKKI